MLLLDRCAGEEILIGENITVRIVRIEKLDNGKLSVRVGIDAPKNVPVHRYGVYKRLKEETQGGPVPSFADGKEKP